MQSMFLCFFFVYLMHFATAKRKIVVSGANGRTGSLVFKKLVQSPDFFPVGLIRTPKSSKMLSRLGVQPAQIEIVDIVSTNKLKDILVGADSLIICTSAKPKIKILSLIKVFIGKIFKKQFRPEFTFPKTGDPYYVDWIGAQRQIDAAKAAGVKHVIMVSSMGGTQPDNFLNSIGKVDGDEKSGNILVWKRKAEKYLIDSNLNYTIIHPGGLIDKPGGKSRIIQGVDDELLKRQTRTIPREDVAEVCVQALTEKSAINKSFDIVADLDANNPTDNWEEFFEQCGNNKY